jgi:hypothetical protein
MFNIFTCGGKMELSFIAIQANGECWDFHRGSHKYTKHRLRPRCNYFVTERIVIDFRK